MFSGILGGNERTLFCPGQFFTLDSLCNPRAFRAFVEKLEKQGLAEILAEPRLVTLSGRQVSFLDGGEQAIPVPKGSGSMGVQFEEFGTRINCLPRVLGNGKIHLEIEPEVSQLDSASGTTIGGAVVPGRITQRVRTTVELKDGQSLVTGGLVQHVVKATLVRDPVLGEVPFVGSVFSTKEFQEVETELVFLITPHLLSGNRTADATSETFEQFLEAILKAADVPGTTGRATKSYSPRK